MPSHPDRVRRNYPPGWWKEPDHDLPLLSHSTQWHPSLWLTAFVLICFVLVGYFVSVGPQ
jgi:hypothetical protein